MNLKPVNNIIIKLKKNLNKFIYERAQVQLQRIE